MESANTAKNLLDQTSESIYDTVKCHKDGSVHPILFLKKLATKGILEDDPRINECVTELRAYTEAVTKEQFFTAIAHNISIIEQAFTDSFVIPDFPGFCEDFKEIFDSCKS